MVARLVPMKDCPRASMGRGFCKFNGRTCLARPPRLDRVESRFRWTPRDAPETLVAPPEGVQTAVFAARRASRPRHRDTNGKAAGRSRGGRINDRAGRRAGARSFRLYHSAYNRPKFLIPPFGLSQLASHQEIS